MHPKQGKVGVLNDLYVVFRPPSPSPRKAPNSFCPSSPRLNLKSVGVPVLKKVRMISHPKNYSPVSSHSVRAGRCFPLGVSASASATQGWRCGQVLGPLGQLIFEVRLWEFGGGTLTVNSLWSRPLGAHGGVHLLKALPPGISRRNFPSIETFRTFPTCARFALETCPVFDRSWTPLKFFFTTESPHFLDVGPPGEPPLGGTIHLRLVLPPWSHRTTHECCKDFSWAGLFCSFRCSCQFSLSFSALCFFLPIMMTQPLVMLAFVS